MNKLNEKNFNKMYMPTIGVDFSIKKIKVNDERIKLQIWDTVRWNYSLLFYMILFKLILLILPKYTHIYYKEFLFAYEMIS